MSLSLFVRWQGRELEKEMQGTVHSVFRRACNLLDGQGRLVAVLGPDLPRAAWAMRLESLPCALDERLKPGMAFACDRDSLRIPAADMELDRASARLWLGDQLSLGGVVPTASRQRVLACAERAGWPGVCRLLSPGALPSESRGLDAALLARFAAGREGLGAAARRCDVPKALEAAGLLLGLGSGLTPAGDDFLGGFLAGLRAGAVEAKRRDFAESFGRALLPQVPTATNRIAGAFLAHACLGSFSETLGGLARALRNGCSGPELDRRTEALLAFGGSSGADTLSGLLSAVTPFSDASRRRFA